MFSFLMLLTAGLMLMIGLLGATAAQIIGARWFAGVSENHPSLYVMRGFLSATRCCCCLRSCSG